MSHLTGISLKEPAAESCREILSCDPAVKTKKVEKKYKDTSDSISAKILDHRMRQEFN